MRALAIVIVLGTVAFAAPAATHFSHADHASRGVDVDTCETCHGVDAAGQVLPPAALGHSPCQSAKCHATYFLAKPGDAKAAAFCLGCHDSKDGTAPKPWTKPSTGAVLASFQYEREYHVEMNHFEHALRGECRTCHIVDKTSYALIRTTPGHSQCVGCHNAQKFPDFTMAKCGLCHDKPARAEFFAGSRPHIDVRACESEGQAALETKLKHKISCFRHERVEHRRAQDGSDLQCSACHYMVGDKSKWGGHRFQTLKDLHTEAIIDNSQDRQHKSCGRAGCHQADVDAARANAKCSLCHAEKSAF